MFWDGLVEERIRNAMAQGAFNNLPGAGRPIPDLNEPYDEMWWIRKWLRREGVNLIPESLARRKEFLARFQMLLLLANESDVRRAVDDLNADVARWNATTTSGPTTDLAGLDVEKTVRRWREQKRPGPRASSPATSDRLIRLDAGTSS